MSAVTMMLDANTVVGSPKKGARRFWTGREELILRNTYPTGGLAACIDALPGRTAKAIYNRAGSMGLLALVSMGGGRHERLPASPAIDDALRRGYPACKTSADVTKLAQAVMRPRAWIHTRATRLGLKTPRFKPLPWSDEEKAIIRQRATQHPGTIRSVLKRAGFSRTDTAIVVQLRRMGASRVEDNPDVFTARGLGELMGVDGSTVAGWISKGMLKARRVESGPTGDWGIHRRDVRQFVIEHAAHVDLRKVDRFWFIDMMAGRAA